MANQGKTVIVAALDGTFEAQVCLQKWGAAPPTFVAVPPHGCSCGNGVSLLVMCAR